MLLKARQNCCQVLLRAYPSCCTAQRAEYSKQSTMQPAPLHSIAIDSIASEASVSAQKAAGQHSINRSIISAI